MNALERLITTSAELGAARVLETLGITSGEISQRKAAKTYGKWFTDAVANGRIFPARVEDGKAGTRWFRVVDILSLKTADAARAKVLL